MTPTSLLMQMSQALGTAGIPFMLTGSMAASYHGAGRATMDIDLVIDPTAVQLESLLVALDRPGVYVPREAAKAAFDDRTMFNVVDIETGWKADMIFRKDRPFSAMEFAPRLPAQFERIPLWITTAEDLVLAKLEWAHTGGSARQLDDVAALLDAAGHPLDFGYIAEWAAQLGLAAEWDAAQRRHERDHQ